jgi:hypothetical protein
MTREGGLWISVKKQNFAIRRLPGGVACGYAENLA